MWSLQITEPDLGSEPGNPAQQRQAVPGRVIETNIGFCIQGKTLECGFQTVISDPVGSGAQADVYRLAVVRRLMESPVFGLTHILPLNGGTLLSQKHRRAPEDADPYHRPKISCPL